MFERLTPYGSCAWDFDGTLYDHPKSEMMARYIRSTPEKRHVLLTFRSHGWQHLMWDDLAKLYRAPLRESDFDEVANLPDRIYEEFHMASRGIVLPDDPAMKAYLEWKARVCVERGLEVLIDDDHIHAPGCRMHGVVHIHPDDL